MSAQEPTGLDDYRARALRHEHPLDIVLQCAAEASVFVTRVKSGASPDPDASLAAAAVVLDRALRRINAIRGVES